MRLLVRLTAKRSIPFLAASAAERHQLAAARVLNLRAKNITAQATRAKRSDAAAARRALAVRVRRVKLEAKMGATAAAAANLLDKRKAVTRAKEKRVTSATAK